MSLNARQRIHVWGQEVRGQGQQVDCQAQQGLDHGQQARGRVKKVKLNILTLKNPQEKRCQIKSVKLWGKKSSDWIWPPERRWSRWRRYLRQSIVRRSEEVRRKPAVGNRHQTPDLGRAGGQNTKTTEHLNTPRNDRKQILPLTSASRKWKKLRLFCLWKF